jgi:hypothetical protein
LILRVSGTISKPRIEEKPVSRIVKAGVPNLSLKDPSLIARAMPLEMVSITSCKLEGRAYSEITLRDEYGRESKTSEKGRCGGTAEGGRLIPKETSRAVGPEELTVAAW